MKRFISILLIALMLFCLVSCAPKKQNGPVTIAATCFAAYDFARSVAGDTGAEVKLIGGGADLHSYNPSAEDILTVAECDLLVYVGGESDSWVSDIERKENSETVNMLDAIGSRVHYLHDHGKETEISDEHVWMSIDNAHLIVKAISDALSHIDSKNELKYDDNREQFSLKLNGLDMKFREAVKGYTLPTVVVADRFAFAYMFKDYNIGWYSAFDTCSADSEVSFETVTKLAGVVDKYSVTAIAVTESVSPIATAVAQATKNGNCEIVTLDTMQSAKENSSYIEIMQKNADALGLLLFEEK